MINGDDIYVCIYIWSPEEEEEEAWTVLTFFARDLSFGSSMVIGGILAAVSWWSMLNGVLGVSWWSIVIGGERRSSDWDVWLWSAPTSDSDDLWLLWLLKVVNSISSVLWSSLSFVLFFFHAQKHEQRLIFWTFEMQIQRNLCGRIRDNETRRRRKTIEEYLTQGT